MLATETLYTLRKRKRIITWGGMRAWLSFHIFTGIVGPYLVFLHTGFRFAGLAGATTLMTGIVVFSGFIGRYIYNAIPRTPAGAELEIAQLEAAIQRAESQLQAWLAARPAQLQALATQMGAVPVVSGTGVKAILWQGQVERDYRRRWQAAVARIDEPIRQQTTELDGLICRRRELQCQMALLSVTRRLLARWHVAHVPLAMSLFVAAFMHIVAALYYR